MPSASASQEREVLQMLVDWIQMAIRCSSEGEFLRSTLPGLRTAVRADSVAWVTNIGGRWTAAVQTGASRSDVPESLLASAADEDLPVQHGSWLLVPVFDATATHLLVIDQGSTEGIAAWVPSLARALCFLRQVVRTRIGGSTASERRTPANGSATPSDRASTVALIGESPGMQELRKRIPRIADSELTVLVHGENGTGKDIVSRMIHDLSPRAAGPWLVVNCAAIAESLLESELFGHERGAFTDAKETRAGKFELAKGGTLFLDEVGELSPRAQAQLLRVLEDKMVVRVGGHEPIPVDTRLVAATNRNLAQMVQSELFRRDLFFRLNVVTLELPPLRERGDDIGRLAGHFLEEASGRRGRSSPRLTQAALQALHAYPWPGNVRELRNLMERVAFLCDDDQIDVGQLGLSLPATQTPFSVDSDLSLADATRQFQIAFIEHHLRGGIGNMTDTAQRLGLHRTNLYRKMKQLGMTPPS